MKSQKNLHDQSRKLAVIFCGLQHAIMSGPPCCLQFQASFLKDQSSFANSFKTSPILHGMHPQSLAEPSTKWVQMMPQTVAWPCQFGLDHHTFALQCRSWVRPGIMLAHWSDWLISNCLGDTAGHAPATTGPLGGSGNGSMTPHASPAPPPHEC